MQQKKIANFALCITLIVLIGMVSALPAEAQSMTKQLNAVYRNIHINVSGSPIEPINILSRLVLYKPLYFNAFPVLIKNVEVSTAAELVAAIAPDTCITLKAGLYDLSTVAGAENPYVMWHMDEYGKMEQSLVVHDVSGLTLQAATGAEVEIVTPYRFAAVLSFDQCNGISLQGIKAGHSVIGDYECDRGVIYFDNTSNIRVGNCLFYGCGSIGINLTSCVSADIENTVITDCSLYAVYMWSCADINFNNCKLVDNRAYMNVIGGYSSTAAFSDCEISGNKSLMNSVVDIGNDVLFSRCTFKDNALVSGYQAPVIAGEGIRLKNCTVQQTGFNGYWSEIIDLGGNVLK